MAELFVFPSHRRIGLIKSIVNTMLQRSHTAGETYLQHRLKVQAETVERCGSDVDKTLKDFAAIKSAVRAVLWQKLLLRETI